MIVNQDNLDRELVNRSDTIKPSIDSTNSMTNLLSRITQIPDQCGGRPCIRGMRIRVSDILEMLAENVGVDEILQDFPDLELEDIQACLLLNERKN